MDKETAINIIIEHAEELLQDHLDNYGHGDVEDVDIDSLGWGEDCGPVLMLRAYRFLKNKEK